MTVDDLLSNWVRWLADTTGCYPQGYPPSVSVDDIALPYKILITEDEALDELDQKMPVYERAAVRCEEWVIAMPPTERHAVQIQYIHLPEWMRFDLGKSPDQWQEWRARRLGKALKRHIKAEDYQEALGRAFHILRERIDAWKSEA